MMLSGEKRDDPSSAGPTSADAGSVPKRARVELQPTGPPPQPPQPKPHAAGPSVQVAAQKPDGVIAAASSAARRDAAAAASPYSDLQRAVHNALESKTAALTTSDKVALALEVLRARQLELDLAQARNNIEALVTKTGSAPRTLRAVIPASTVKGLPVGTPIDVSTGKFLLSPTTDDPTALFLTLELQSFGPQRQQLEKGVDAQPSQPGAEMGPEKGTNSTGAVPQASAPVMENKATDEANGESKALVKQAQEEQKPM